MEEQHRELRGARFFGRPLRDNYADEALAEAWKYGDIVIDRHNFTEAATAWKALRAREGQIKATLDEAARFWSPANLELALVLAYGQHAPGKLVVHGSRVTIEDRTLVIDGTRRVVLGIDGVVG